MSIRIKSKVELTVMREANQIVARTHQLLSEAIKPGVTTYDLDKLAKGGLTYTRFHTTALCSPTRGALLAGRNHHTISTGVITECGTGYPGDGGRCGVR